MSFFDILKTALPLIGTLVGGPAGGAIGSAISGIGGGEEQPGQPPVKKSGALPFLGQVGKFVGNNSDKILSGIAAVDAMKKEREAKRVGREDLQYLRSQRDALPMLGDIQRRDMSDVYRSQNAFGGR